MSEREAAIFQEALADLRNAKSRGGRTAAPLPVAPAAPRVESEVEKTIEIPLEARLAAQQASQATARRAAQASGTGESGRNIVFSPAGMDPELATKIALLMEHDADEREERRHGRRKLMLTIATTTLVLLFGALAIGMMSAPPVAVQKARKIAQPFAMDPEPATPAAPAPSTPAPEPAQPAERP